MTTGFNWKDLKVLNPAITERTSGNVGIGTIAPATKLAVA